MTTITDTNDTVGMERHEKWILGVIFTSILSAILELGFSLGDGELGLYSLWIAPSAAGLTLIFHLVTLPIWRHTTKKPKFNSPSFIYSITVCVISCLLAVLWLAAMCTVFILVPVYYIIDGHAKVRVVPWMEAVFSVVNMGLMWAEFGLVVHYRNRFFKRQRAISDFSQQQFELQQPLQAPPPSPKKLEAKSKLILRTIVVTLCISLAELGVSLGDGLFGGYSGWMAPVGAGLTAILHVVTLFVWKHTAKARKGTLKPSFIHSVTLCVLTGLLAVYWLAPTIMTFILTWLGDTDPDSGIYHEGTLVIPWIEAALALILTGLMWFLFVLMLVSRKHFLRQAKAARYYVSQSQATTIATPTQEA
ncbi:hypothetical protein FRC15_000663 [Serendipita sp. 397]|nr:hypothetical protein FRC15_000663 [Serendipita sp. 397]